MGSISMRWPWPNDVDTQTWPRCGQDVPPCQKVLCQAQINRFCTDTAAQKHWQITTNSCLIS